MVLLNHRGQSLTHLLVHAIFSTKDRTAYIVENRIPSPQLPFTTAFEPKRLSVRAATCWRLKPASVT